MLAQYGMVGGKGSPVLKILIVGHSKSRGNSSAVGDNPKGTLSEWDAVNSKIVTVGATDVLDAVGGSQWPAFAEAYFRLTGRRVQICNNGIGGSGYRYDIDGTLSWYTTGTLWASSVTKARNWLNHVGAVNPDLVVLHLGVNDANKAPVTTTYADMTNLIDRINTEYNSPRIMVVQEATNSAVFLTTWQLQFNLNQFRKYQKQLSFDYLNVEVATHEGNITQWQTAGAVFQADGVHLNKDGNDFLGARLARQAALGKRFHKAAKHWIGNNYFNPSGYRRELLNDLAVALDAAGLLQLLDALHVTSNEANSDTVNRYKNSAKDFAYISPGGPAAAGMVLFDGMLGNGTTDNWFEGQYTQFENKAIFLSDFICGVYLVDNVDPAGTVGTLIGTRESPAGGIIYLGQNVANQLEWCACDGAVDTDATETAFADNNWYAVARSGGNKILIKNSTVVRTVARAAAALNPGGNLRGSRYLAYNNNGSLANHANAKIAVTYVAKYSTWNQANFVSIMNAFLSSWLVNNP